MNPDDRTSSPTETANQGFYYGWIIVAACLITTIMAYGVHYSFGVFFKPLQDEFDWSRTVTSSVFSFYQISHTVLGLLAGWATDRYGPRITIALGGIALGVGLVLTSQVNALWQLYISYGLLLGLGISAAWSPVMTTVSRWFTKRRGLALGIVSAGIGLGTVIMSPLASHLISSYGWSRSYLIIGIAGTAVILLSSIFLRKSPLGKGETQNSQNAATYQSGGMSFREAIRTRTPWILLTMWMLLTIGLFMVMTHVVRYAQDTGIPPLTAAAILSTIGATSIAGRITMGAISDRIGIRKAIVICMVSQGILIAWLATLSATWEFYLFAVLFGFAYGGSVPLFPALTGELFGVGHMGLLLAFVTIGGGIGGALGPLLAGHIFDTTGSYFTAFLIGALLSILSIALLPLLKAHIDY
jgi:MFS family permease